MCSLCFSVFSLSSFFPIHLTLYYCPLCYSVFSLSSLFLSFSPVITVLSVILSSFYPLFHLPTLPSLLFPLLLCLLLLCPFFTFLSHFLIVHIPCYFSSTKATFHQVLTLFFCFIQSLLSIAKPSIYVFICTYFHIII